MCGNKEQCVVTKNTLLPRVILTTSFRLLSLFSPFFLTAPFLASCLCHPLPPPPQLLLLVSSCEVLPRGCFSSATENLLEAWAPPREPFATLFPLLAPPWLPRVLHAPGTPRWRGFQGLLSEWGGVCEHVCVRARVRERGRRNGMDQGLEGLRSHFLSPRGRLPGGFTPLSQKHRIITIKLGLEKLCFVLKNLTSDLE